MQPFVGGLLDDAVESLLRLTPAVGWHGGPVQRVGAAEMPPGVVVLAQLVVGRAQRKVQVAVVAGGGPCLQLVEQGVLGVAEPVGVRQPRQRGGIPGFEFQAFREMGGGLLAVARLLLQVAQVVVRADVIRVHRQGCHKALPCPVVVQQVVHDL